MHILKKIAIGCVAFFGVLFFYSSILFLFPHQANAQSPEQCKADINADGTIDLRDYSLLIAKFFAKDSPETDLNGDNVTDLTDYSILISYFFQNTSSCFGTPTPTSPPVANPDEWVQFAHDSQHSNYSPQPVSEPWKLAWIWNGPDNQGKYSSSHINVPNLIQPITGDGRVYMVGGNTVYALDKNTGQELWKKGSIGTLTGTPAYDNGYLYVPSSNGTVYKLAANTGATAATFNAGSSIPFAVTFYNGVLYVPSTSGNFYAVKTSDMTKLWEYAGGSPAVGPMAISPNKQLAIAYTQDLNVHAIKLGNGQRQWRVKPTPRTYQSGNPNSSGAQFEDGWPVIAEQHGIVLVRYRLDWNTLWAWNPYPETNQQIKSNLQNNPNQQSLFALNMNDGSVAFIPAVGNGGHGDGDVLPMGPQPIVKIVDGKEVVYIIWRNGLTCKSASWCDGREDSMMGEMVLDSSTVSGYQAGDLRFVNFEDIQTDEMMNITMAGNTIFHTHWLINAAKTITDRSANLGNTFANAIKTKNAPYTIWRQCYCPPDNPQCNPVTYPGGSGYTACGNSCAFNNNTHYCSSGLFSYGDQRGYPSGFYEYHNTRPSESSATSSGYTIASDGLVIIKTYYGGLMVLKNGNPQSSLSSNTNVAGASVDLENIGQTSIPTISYTQASQYVNRVVTAEGTIRTVDNHLPKAMYLGFKNPHDGALLIRVFQKNLNKFNYDLQTLNNKKIRVTGFVSLYWPELTDPEIIVTDPAQIEIIKE